MAEARSAVSYRVERSNLLFEVTEEEVILHINKNVLPATVSRLHRTLIRSAYRSRNALFNAFYPAPPLQWGLLVTAPAAIMIAVPPETPQEDLSVMLALLKPVSVALWNLEAFIPTLGIFSAASSSSSTGTMIKAGLVSASVGTGFTLVMSYLRRFLLSALLTYQGWIYDDPKTQNLKTNIWAVCTSLSHALI